MAIVLLLISLTVFLQCHSESVEFDNLLEIVDLGRAIPTSPSVFVKQIPFFDYIPSLRNPLASNAVKNFNKSVFITRLVPRLFDSVHPMSDDHYDNATHHLIRKRQGTSCCSCGCCIQQTCCPSSWCGGSCGGSSSGCGGGCGCQQQSGCGCSSGGCGCGQSSCGCSSGGCGCGGSSSCGCQTSSCGCGGYGGYGMKKKRETLELSASSGEDSLSKFLNSV